MLSHVWWCEHATLAFERLKQEDYEFEASLVNIEKHWRVDKGKEWEQEEEKMGQGLDKEQGKGKVQSQYSEDAGRRITA